MFVPLFNQVVGEESKSMEQRVAKTLENLE